MSLIEHANDETPKKGQVVLLCAHLAPLGRIPDGAHYFNVHPEPCNVSGCLGGRIYKRPDGKVGAAKWIVACGRCCVTAFERGESAVPIGGDFVLGEDVSHMPQAKA